MARPSRTPSDIRVERRQPHRAESGVLVPFLAGRLPYLRRQGRRRPINRYLPMTWQDVRLGISLGSVPRRTSGLPGYGIGSPQHEITTSSLADLSQPPILMECGVVIKATTVVRVVVGPYITSACREFRITSTRVATTWS